MDAEGRHDAIENSLSEELVASQGISDLADMALERYAGPLQMSSWIHRTCLATRCFFEVSSHAFPVPRIAPITLIHSSSPFLSLTPF